MLYPSAEFRPVRNTSGFMVEPTRGLIPHVQVGRNSLFGWFDNPSSQVSAHLWLSETGDFEQYVPFNRRAWAQAAGNSYWISVECAGFDSEDYTPIQVQRLAELYAWGMREFGWAPQVTDSPDGYGLGTHRMGGKAWGLHRCPGPIRAGRRGDILRQALAINSVQQLREDPDMPLTPADCEAVADTVLGKLWEQMGERPQGAAADWHQPFQAHAGAVLRRTYETSGDAIARLDRIERGLSAAAPAAAQAMVAPLPLATLLDAVTRLDAVDAIRLAHAASAHAVGLVPTQSHPEETL
ncbi:N-acetylmuramoyl-L-alanine amidase [Frankia sp. Mgl5]|nr:N-acetylmuramoyl-L-alanine amidase [Frankia sp. Mgl5]